MWDVLPLGLSVEEWRHRATLGRDHYVRIVYQGRLFPWGHRASVVKVTERQFHPKVAGNPAYLRQRMFLVVKEPQRTYGHTGLVYDGPIAEQLGEQIDLMLPFQTVRITTLVSPLLDPPEKDQIGGKAQGCFWPNVGGQPFQFHLVGTDVEGQDADFSMPLIFVGKEETDEPYVTSIIPDDLNPGTEDAVTKFENDPWPGSSQKRSTVPFFGQSIAFAKSADPDDTTFAVQSLTFGAFVPQAGKYNSMDPLEPRFFPIVRTAQIDVPALQAIARTTAPAGVVYAAPYLQNGFLTGNEGEVFLARDPAAAAFNVKFSSQGDRSGGLVTPDLSLSGLSRITGPVSGSLETSAGGSFNPNVWFGAITGAKLFGVLKLGDILGDAGFDELDKLPRFVGQALNQVERLLSDLVRLRQRLAVESVPDVGAVAFLLGQLTDPDTGSIPALLNGGTVLTVASQLALLNAELQTLGPKIDASALPPGVKAVVAQSLAGLQSQISTVIGATEPLEQFAAGGDLPKALQARLEWRPKSRTSATSRPAPRTSSATPPRPSTVSPTSRCAIRERGPEHLKAIRREAQEMSRVTNDFLLFARPEGFVPETGRPRGGRGNRGGGDRKGLSPVSGRAPGDFPEVSGSTVLLRRALVNLLRNAVEATPPERRGDAGAIVLKRRGARAGKSSFRWAIVGPASTLPAGEDLSAVLLDQARGRRFRPRDRRPDRRAPRRDRGSPARPGGGSLFELRLPAADTFPSPRGAGAA